MTAATAQRTALPWILAAAAAQLIVLGVVSPAGAVQDVAACALALAVPLAASHALRSWRSWHTMAIVGALGGLGMLIGAVLDARSSNVPACHAGAAGLFSWMTGAMIVGCVPACVWLAPACRARRSWPGHAACFVGMMLGMVLGGRWLPPILDAMVTPPATHHLAMLLGMMLGAAGGHRAFHEDTVLDPPGSITSATARGRHDRQAPLPAGSTAQLRGAAEP